MEQFFIGKTALITGACRGIGNAIALLYAAHGAKVIVSDLNRRAGKDIVAKIKSKNGAATFLRADVSIPAECKNLVSKAIQVYGSIDIACNNSAVSGEFPLPGHQSSEAFNIGNEMNINYSSLYCCMKYEVEAMQRQGGGVIINMSSPSGDFGLEVREYTHGAYSAKGIRINTIVQEYMIMALLEDANLRECKTLVKLPSTGLSKIDQVANLVVWLSTEEVPPPIGRDQR